MYLDKFKDFKSYKTETTPCKIKLSSNENPFDLPDWLKDRISEEVKKIHFQRYPDPTSSELKEVIADFYGVKPENIVLGNGSDELIQLLTVIIGDCKEPVMYPIPTFPMYQVSADIVGRRKVEFLLDENFQLTEEGVEEAVKKKPSLAFFASPNNPTGNTLNSELIKRVIKQGIFTVIDEAYIDFSDKESFLDYVLETKNAVVLRTMSKIGLAGLRLGVLIGNKDVASVIDKTRQPFNITLPTQIIGKIVLTEGRDVINEQIRILKSERDFMLTELNKINGIKVFPSDANFILIRVKDGNKLHKKLIEKGILVRNMSHLPQMENCLRVSIGKPDENREFLKTLKDLV